MMALGDEESFVHSVDGHDSASCTSAMFALNLVLHENKEWFRPERTL